MKKLFIVTLLLLSACTGRGAFEQYYEVLEQDDFQMTIRAHCSRKGCPSIFNQANEVAKAHCSANNKNYTLSSSWTTGNYQGWERMRKYKCKN